MTTRRRRRSKVTVDPKFLIAYLRVSTQEQAESGAGLAAQRLAIETWAKLHGYTIVDWKIDEGASGKNLKREALQETLDLIEQGKAAGLVVSKLDRLSRSMLDFCNLTADATKGQWNIVALDINLDLSTPNGELIAGIMALFAQWERKIIGQRTKDGLAAKKAAGVRLGALRVIDDELLAKVVEVWQGCDMVYNRTALRLRELGVPTPTGRGNWHPDSVRKLLLHTPHGQEAVAA